MLAPAPGGHHLERRCAGDFTRPLGSEQEGSTLIEVYGGGPAGIQAIAAAVGEDRGTIEDLYEPYLLQEGFLQRTPRGRVATRRAFEHLGYPPPSGNGPTLFS